MEKTQKWKPLQIFPHHAFKLTMMTPKDVVNVATIVDSLSLSHFCRGLPAVMVHRVGYTFATASFGTVDVQRSIKFVGLSSFLRCHFAPRFVCVFLHQ
jgi:hypothetical protein